MAVLPTTDLLEEALALHRRGAVAEAATRYAEVLRAEPDNADAHYYLGMMACQQGRFADGAECARRSLATDPRHARAHVLLGRALSALGRHDESLASLERAIALAPALAQAHGHRADLLSEAGRNAEAIESYDRAVALAPECAEDWFNRGTALIAVGRYEDALASFDRAVALKPSIDQGHSLGALRLLAKLRLCDWSSLEAESAQVLTMIAEQRPLSVPFAALAIPSSPADQLNCARRYVQEQPVYPQIWRGEIYRHDRIRIAYLSADFREHATAYLTAGLFEQHDKSRFEVTAISFGHNDRSEIRRRLEGAFEHFIDVEKKSDGDIADIIRSREVDIAVDLMGFTKDARVSVLARRPAPIQVNYLGFPGTMGAGFIDYILADPTVIPEHHDTFYAERVVRLPDTYQVNDDKRQINPHTPSRRECGLPDNGFVFCCFNHTQKLSPATFDIWMRLLRARENSVLWLLEGSATASSNLRAAAERRGVSAQRLVFAPKASLADHLARQRQADLFLDTLPVNAHTTASDALWVGLPVLTQIGETFVGKVAASLLRAIDLPELITPSPQAYEALALELAANPEKLAAIKNKLAQNRPAAVLFDTRLFTRRIEQAYAAMYERYQAGLPPASFSIPS